MAKASATARGYGADHQQERKRWQPTVDAGLATCHAVVCLKPSRAIAPDEPWDLGHNPERTRWTGPEHERCNRSEGGRRGADVTNGKRAADRTHQAWEW